MKSECFERILDNNWPDNKELKKYLPPPDRLRMAIEYIFINKIENNEIETLRKFTANFGKGIEFIEK